MFVCNVGAAALAGSAAVSYGAVTLQRLDYLATEAPQPRLGGSSVIPSHQYKLSRDPSLNIYKQVSARVLFLRNNIISCRGNSLKRRIKRRW